MAFKRGNSTGNALTGTPGVDLLTGLGGDDRLDGGAGNDLLLGGPGSDTLLGAAGNDFIIADEDRDRVDGGAGNDFVVAALRQPGSGIKDAPTVPALREAKGGDGEDFLLLNATAANEIKFAFGAKGTQRLSESDISGFESGFIIGTDGTFGDTLQGSGFRLDAPPVPLSTLNAVLKQVTKPSDKADLKTIGLALLTAMQFNGFSGEGGRDRLTASFDTEGGPITRGLRLDGGSLDDTITLSISSAAVRALANANGTFQALAPDGSRTPLPIVEVNGGDDTFGFDDDVFNLRLPANLATPISIGPPNANQVALVKAGGDLIVKTLYIDHWNLQLGAGNDRITLGFGDDTVRGNDGRDTLSGGAGDDILEGGAGADRLIGGDGNDTVAYSKQVTVNVLAPAKGAGHAKGDSFNSIETFRLSSGADTFIGGNQAESVLGAAGNDVLRGGGGNDTLAGGQGADTLAGGGGADTFRFIRPTEGIDRLDGFVSGEDKMQFDIGGFSGAFFILVKGPNPQAEPFSPTYLYDTDNGHLSFDRDGRGGEAAVHFATLAGAPDLNLGDLGYLF